MWINEKLPLHTFLPSPAEVLPLLLPMSVVIAMMAIAMVLRLVTLDATRLFLLTPLLIFINRVVGGALLWVCGSLGDKVPVWFVIRWICGSFLKHPRFIASPLCPGLPLALVEDVWLVTGGCCEVLSLSEAARHRSQEVVCIRCSD